MKNIEVLVTDLETSKQLQEAGIKYDTAFVWVKFDNKREFVLMEEYRSRFVMQFREKIISAFTACELMQVLPSIIDIEKPKYARYFLKSQKLDKKFFWGYQSSKYRTLIGFCDLPIQALAKLCLWCRKEGYL